MSSRARLSVSRRRQQGAVAVTAAVALIALLTCLVLVLEIGRVYNAQRTLQKMATFAALDAARIVSGCGSEPTQARLEAAVADSLVRNGHPEILNDTEIEVGTIETNADSLRELSPTDLDEARAVRVTLKRPFPSMLTPLLSQSGGSMVASATATQEVLGSLSVGTGLVSINSSESALLNPLLTGLLGGSVNLTAVQYNGLAGVNVSLEQLATAIGVDVKDLSDPLTLSAQTPILSDVLGGLAGALGDTASGTVTGLLTQLAGSASNEQVPLSLILDPVTSVAGNVPFINLLDLILALGQAAQADPSGGATPIALPVQLSVPGVANVSTFVRILEPPRFGGLGRPGKTSASTAQIRVLVRIEAGQILTGLTSAIQNLVNGLLGILNVAGISPAVSVVPPPLNIGIDLDVAKATAYLDAIQCPRDDSNDGEPIAELSVAPAIADITVGRFVGNAATAPALIPTDIWQIATVGIDATNACLGIKIGNLCVGVPLNLGNTTVTLNLGLVAVDVGAGGGRVPLPQDVTEFDRIEGLPDNAPPAWLARGVPPQAPVSANPQTVGAEIDVELQANLSSTQTGSGLIGVLGGLVNSLVNGVAALLQPLIALVNGLADALINPLLDLLGIDLGSATVTMRVVTVDQPGIVSKDVPESEAP